MTIEEIHELEEKIARGESGWQLGEFMAEDVIEAYYLGGGQSIKKNWLGGKPVGGS